MRVNPYANFRLRLSCNGNDVAGFTRADAVDLDRSPFTLHRGLICDPEFHHWCGSGNVQMKRDLTLHLFNEQEQIVMSYAIRGAWPLRYDAIVDIPDQIAVERLALDHQGVIVERST